MRIHWLLPGMIVCVLAAEPVASEAQKRDQRQFQGTWRFVSVEAGGKTLPEEGYKNAVLVIEENRHTTKHGAVTYSGTFAIDAGKKPKTIDLHFTDGPEKGKTSYGIYELDGDTLKLCVGLVGKDRPKEFASKPGSGHVVEVLKREKKKD